MGVSPFDHDLLSGLLGDDEVAALFSPEAEIAGIVAFEQALASAEAAEGVIPEKSGEAIAERIADIELDISALRAATARDGVVVPELVRQLRAGLPAAHRDHLHFGATSQDAIDTSLALRLKRLAKVLGKRIDALAAMLDELDHRDGHAVVMAHTRMQAAIEVTAARKIASWRDPLLRARLRLDQATEGVAQLQFGGAAGTLDRLGKEAVTVARHMAEQLDLLLPARPWHSERDGVVAFASWLSMLTGALGKMGQDIALMAQSEIAEVRLSLGGGSSAMPHKVNPVGAEALVALARFNATLVSGMHHSLVHENERSGAAWTLEWMLLPQMAVAAGAALRTAQELVPQIGFAKR